MLAARTASDHGERNGTVHLATLDEIQRRVLWPAVRMVDHATRERRLPPAPGRCRIVDLPPEQIATAAFVAL